MMIELLCAAIGLVVGGSQALQVEQAPDVVVEEISRSRTTATGQPIELPRGGVEVVASIYTIPPGATLAVHKHRFPRYAYVLSGTIQVTATETGQVFSYKTGAFITEMIDQWHRAANKGKDPVRLLVIDQVEPGASNTVLAARD